MELLNALKWRYAVKKMNGKAVAEQDVEAIVEAARMAPTSAGIQPFEVIVISNPELKKQILPIAFNQQQIVDCSHLLVFAAWDNYTTERIEEYINRTETERGMPVDAMADFKDKLLSNFTTKGAEVNAAHAARQAYIGFGVAIAAAAELKVDSTPMEGFNNEELDKLLGLDKKGLKSVTLLPLGHRDHENDWLVNLKKIRVPKEKFVTEFK
ncbi:MAG: NAD(P)H-dependent oxidoreductase [Bacteroidota bacterium]